MSALELPPLNDNVEDLDDPGPHVFVRIISAPPGAPWDQSRQATLEARLGAPSRLSDLVFRVRRLESWRPGRGARFAAIYARADQANRGLHAEPVIDGRPVRVSFVSAAEQRRQVGVLLGVALASMVVVMSALGIVGMVQTRRANLDDLLSATEAMAHARAHQARELERLDQETSILDGQHLREQRLGSVLATIAWASNAKSPSAHVQALHWDHGFLALEVSGDRPPFDDPGQAMERSKAPIRPGVWLWGLPTTEPWGPGSPAPRRAAAADAIAP